MGKPSEESWLLGFRAVVFLAPKVYHKATPYSILASESCTVKPHPKVTHTGLPRGSFRREHSVSLLALALPHVFHNRPSAYL